MRLIDANKLKEEVLKIQGEDFVSDDKSVLFTRREVLAIIDGVIDNVIVIFDNCGNPEFKEEGEL